MASYIALPTIHPNGTSRDALVEQRTDILDALRSVIDAMGVAWPHGRDYYPPSYNCEMLTRAQNIARTRVANIQDLIAEIHDEAIAISNLGA